jgi:hypothetical protein
VFEVIACLDLDLVLCVSFLVAGPVVVLGPVVVSLVVVVRMEPT